MPFKVVWTDNMMRFFEKIERIKAAIFGAEIESKDRRRLEMVVSCLEDVLKMCREAAFAMQRRGMSGSVENVIMARLVDRITERVKQ